MATARRALLTGLVVFLVSFGLLVWVFYSETHSAWQTAALASGSATGLSLYILLRERAARIGLAAWVDRLGFLAVVVVTVLLVLARLGVLS